jgi:methionyl-tRNA synthetase
MRLDGREVRFLTGTDEHGQKVEQAARAAGMEPQAFTDQVSTRFRDLADAWKFSHDDFIRTTEDRHVRAVQALWQRLEANGDIYLGTYAGWYSVRDEAFWAENEIKDGKAPSGAPVEWVEEPSYFFRLSAWADRLLEHYRANPDFILPESRRNEVMRFVEGGLHDLSVSRTSFAWGIPVPGNPDHVIYVWLDALTNYLSAVGYPDTAGRDYERFWPADIHMVGKDILRFHAVYWPAFLMAAGVEPPRRIFAHGWWTNEGQKISKSLGNVIDPHELVATYGLDQVRYFLLREVPFGQDGDFSHRAMVHRMNADLANDYGNLAQRSLSMIHKNCGAAVPEPAAFDAADTALMEAAAALPDGVRTHMEVQAFHKGLEAIWTVIGEANRYVDAQAPWVLRKSDPERMRTVLYTLAETVRRLAIVTQAFVPDASAKLLDQLAVPAERRLLAHVRDPEAELAPGTVLPRPEGVFPRYVEDAA